MKAKTFSWLLLFAVLLTAFYLRLPFIITALIESSLRDAGLIDVEISTVEVGFRSSKVDEVSFGYPVRRQQGDPALAHVTLKGVQLFYSLDGLRERVLDRLVLQSIQVDLDGNDHGLWDEFFGINISRPDHLLVEGLQLEGLSMALLDGESAMPVTGHVMLLSAKLPAVELSNESLEDVDLKLALDKIAYSRDNIMLQGDLSITALYTGAVDIDLGELMLKTRFLLDENNINADIKVTSSDRDATLQTNLVHSLDTHKGSARITMPVVTLEKNKRQLSNFMHEWPYPFDLHEGTISVDGRLSWGDSHLDEMKLVIDMQDVNGHYEDMIISGVSAKTTVTRSGDVYEVKSQDLVIGDLDTGVALSNIKTRLALSLPVDKGEVVIHLGDLYGDVLGGHFNADNIVLDMNRPENKFILNVEGIDLSRVLEVQSQKGLSGTGVVDGKIPVSITQEGVRIERGELWARQPGGEIRYQLDESGRALGGNNPQLQMLIQTLDNFHYHQLSSDVTFSPEGELLLGVVLEGNNPDIQGGREVHLNLNVEQNILTLLKSLRFTDDISGMIEQQLSR